MLRFDPCEAETEFTMNTFMISKVPSFIAMRHMKQRLYKLLSHVDNVEEYLDTNFKLNGGKLIETVYEEYNKTFSTGAMEKSYPFWVEFDEPRALQKMQQSLFLGLPQGDTKIT